MSKVVFLVFVCLVVIVNADTKTKQCKGFRPLQPSEVDVSNCAGGICRLKRRTKATITLKIKPDRDIKDLTTSVQASIGQFYVPFVGVDGTTACNNIFDESGKKTSCPLRKGQTYIYKNSFDVLELYPRIQLVVRWALKSGNADISCFEIDARIV
ncbi:CLUMA_CG020135, isoform A [Clunio marinus]|uniref:CLUMA_CG020135, isoform A n=1 Tax=Clunio marinus TaxID=568069 RepID=A0A1J1J5T6_9DIPT|nr:CLUMA_CG020135, isoform A [Clunio marinus]